MHELPHTLNCYRAPPGAQGKAEPLNSCQWVLCMGTLKCMPAKVTAAWAFTYGKGHSGSSGWESETQGVDGDQLIWNSESIGSGMTADHMPYEP